MNIVKRKIQFKKPNIKLTFWKKILIGLVVLNIIIWTYIINLFIENIKQNIETIIDFSIILIVLFLIIFLLFHIYKRKLKKERNVFEKKQRQKGLFKFVDKFGNKKWGKVKEFNFWKNKNKQQKQKQKLISKLIFEIENFKPSRLYDKEIFYQIELVGYLKNKFPNVDIEKQKGSSRPDIVVDDISIEIKGPTKTEDLKTIADKCMRYVQHFNEIIIVLFNVNVNKQMYDEWEKGINKNFPNINIIKNNNHFK